VNTGFYIVGEGAGLQLRLCVLDGLESCQRAVCLSAARTRLHLEQCLVRDMFSLVTATSSEPLHGVSVTVSGSCLTDLQEGVRLVVPQGQLVDVQMCRSQATFVLYDADCGTWSGLQLGAAGGNIQVSDCCLHFNHCDGKGLVVRWSGEAGQMKVFRCSVSTTDQIDRKLSIGEGVVVTGGNLCSIGETQVDGFRIGLKLQSVSLVTITTTRICHCSIGVHLPSTNTCTQGMRLSLSDCTMRTLYYGVMGEQRDTRLQLSNNRFIDIPKALLLCQDMVSSLSEESCHYLLSREYVEDSQDQPLLESEMNLYLATQENLPHRVAYQHKEIQLINKFYQLGLDL